METCRESCKRVATFLKKYSLIRRWPQLIWGWSAFNQWVCQKLFSSPESAIYSETVKLLSTWGWCCGLIFSTFIGNLISKPRWWARRISHAWAPGIPCHQGILLRTVQSVRLRIVGMWGTMILCSACQERCRIEQKIASAAGLGRLV